MLSRLRSWLQRSRLLETAVLLSLLVIVGSIWIFVETADEVHEGESQRFDEWVLRSLRHADGTTPLGPPWLLQVARDLTALGGAAVITLITLGALGFLALRRKWGSLCLVVVSIVGGVIVSTLLKHSFERPRPHASLHLTDVSSQSFPSGHSMLAAATYFTLAALLARTTADRRIKAYFLVSAALLALLIGSTRMYLGVHYPTDVLAGWCAGLAWAVLCSLVARWLQRTGAVEQETPTRQNG
jgi:undecaprenyl-diphosphatase